MGVGGQHHAPAALPPGKYPVPIVQEAGWAPPGFDPRTVQPVASRYTDWAIPAPQMLFISLWEIQTYRVGTSALKEVCNLDGVSIVIWPGRASLLPI